MTDTTANLALPFIDAAQAQKHVTHNAALSIIDTLVQLAVLDRDLSAPPSSPTDGQRWIVAASATGAWAGHTDHVAAWQDGAWQFSIPQTGWIAYVIDEGALLVWNGTSWSDVFATITALQTLTLLGVGTTADGTNPFSAKLNTALWTAKTAAESGSGDLRYTMNKEAAANVLSLLMQSGFSGRAEIGLIGDDNLTLKVSADGSSWNTALAIDNSSGAFAGAGGNWGEPIASWTHSADVANVDFTDLGDYRQLLIVGIGLQHNSGSSTLFHLLLSSDNGTTYHTAGGDYGRYGTASGNSALFVIGNSQVAAATSTAIFVELFDFNVAARETFGRGLTAVLAGAATTPVFSTRQVAEVDNALRILPGSGSITAGTIYVYGKR